MLELREYVEYVEGNSPIVLTAPHDGTHKPVEIPERTQGLKIRDMFTSNVAWSICEQSEEISKPHLIVLRLHRSKLDVNRERSKAADKDSTDALEIYDLYHNSILSAIQKAVKVFGFALLLDVHGQGHRKDTIELGYLLNNRHLRSKDEDFETFCQGCSIRHINEIGKAPTPYTLSEVVRGGKSFGDLLMEKGFETIPSSKILHPCKSRGDHVCTKECKFCSGAFTTRKYSSMAKVCAIQVEIPTELRWDRKQPLNDSIFQVAEAIKSSAQEYLETFFLPRL